MNFMDLHNECLSVIDDVGYAAGVDDMINAAVMSIAGGIRMPDRSLSPPLPHLYAMGNVATVTGAAFVALPGDFQREVIAVFSATQQREIPVSKSHIRFLKRYPSLSTPGAVDAVSVKGGNLYYQGIPATPDTLHVHYHRMPTPMEQDDDTPDGIPEHLQRSLIVHRVAWQVFDQIEDGIEGQKINTLYHQRRFYEAMEDLTAVIGDDDGRPEFVWDEYGEDNRF